LETSEAKEELGLTKSHDAEMQLKKSSKLTKRNQIQLNQSLCLIDTASSTFFEYLFQNYFLKII